jgi:MYXO-CTERM domain-containing protein
VWPGVVLLLAAAGPDEAPRIFGGEALQAGDFPALVLVAVADDRQVSLCSGALIAPRWVLTAAHCLATETTGVRDATAGTTVYFDRLDVAASGGRAVAARRTFVHPEYRGVETGHDLALVELAEEITDRLPLAYKIDASELAVGTLVDFVGYGADTPETLLGVGVARTLADQPLVSCAELGEGEAERDAFMLCFDQRNQQGICLGDSGGPALADLGGVPTIVGVNSVVFDPAGADTRCTFFAGATRTDSEVAFLEDTQLLPYVPELEAEEADGCGCRSGGRPRGVGSAWLLVLGLLALRRRRA